MSFFDDSDESRTARRPASRKRRRSGPGRRPPSRQTIIERRAVAAAAILIVVVLIALGVDSCQAGNSALNNYQHSVAALIGQSDQTGSRLFGELSRGGGAANVTNLQNEINQARVSADSALGRARNMNVPTEVNEAQRYLLLALQMRRDAIANIAGEIQPGLATSTSNNAINAIAAEIARLYASDVLYSDYAVPVIVGALHAAGLTVGAVNGLTSEGGQFVPSVQWLTPEYIAVELGARLRPRSGKPAPGVHGHRMDSVSVGGTTMQTGATNTNTVPASPPPTFTCTFTNDGQNTETNVVVKVSVSGTPVSGQAIVSQTTPGRQSTAEVTLNSSPPKGTSTVSATVEQVPGETVLTHNTLSFPVRFQ